MSGTPAETTDATGRERHRWLFWLSLPLAVLAFLARLPGIVEPMGPDQGVYATIGWGMQRGLALYRDLWELKPPGIYLTYRFAFSVFGARESSIFWIDYLAGALTAIVLFDLGRRAVGRRFGAIAAAVFALGTFPAARHTYGGFLERGISEKFISLLAAAAAWAAFRALTSARTRWAVASGALVGLATVYKPFALAYWPAWVLWIWFVSDMARARRFALGSCAGLVVPPVAAIGWMIASGIMPDAWVALVDFNRAYLAVGGVGPSFILDRFAHEIWLRLRSDEVWALGSLGAVIAVGLWRRRATHAGTLAALGVAWLGAALVAIPANGPRMFMTYFLPSLVPLCLMYAWLLDQTLASAKRWRAVAGVLLVLATGAMAARGGSLNRAVTFTRWDARHWLGSLDRLTYLGRYQGKGGRAFSAADNERLAAYLRAHTDPADRIFVFGMTGGTYFSSERLPASRFLFVYPAVSRLVDRPEFRVETLAADLDRASARYVILQRGNGDSFSGWKAEDAFADPAMTALLRGYVRETEIGNFVLYRRLAAQD